MIQFDENQINVLKGQFTAIARSAGVTPQYARMVIVGTRRKNTKKAQDVARKAKLILEILEN